MEVKSEAAARTSWSSSCSSVNRLLHKDSVVHRPDAREDDDFNNKLYSHFDDRLILSQHSPSGSWGLLNTLVVQLTRTLAAASFTSVGCSSLQHEHTSSPHLPKHATAATPWNQSEQHMHIFTIKQRGWWYHYVACWEFKLFITVKYHLKKGSLAAYHQSLPDS